MNQHLLTLKIITPTINCWLKKYPKENKLEIETQMIQHVFSEINLKKLFKGIVNKKLGIVAAKYKILTSKNFSSLINGTITRN